MPTSVQEKRQPFSKGIIRFFGILLLLRHPSFPPSFRAWSADTTIFAMLRLYTWPCAMHRVPGRLRTCAERRLGACLCRLGYGNLAGFPSPRSTFVADINLSIPKERGKNGMPVMGEECEGIVFFRPTIPRNGVPLPCPANE